MAWRTQDIEEDVLRPPGHSGELKRHPLKLKILAHELKDPLACGDRPTEAGYARFYIPRNTLHEYDLASEDEMASSSYQAPNPNVDSDASDEEQEEEEEWENERAVFGLPLTYIRNREGDALDDDEDSCENTHRFQWCDGCTPRATEKMRLLQLWLKKISAVFLCSVSVICDQHDKEEPA